MPWRNISSWSLLHDFTLPATIERFVRRCSGTSDNSTLHIFFFVWGTVQRIFSAIPYSALLIIYFNLKYFLNGIPYTPFFKMIYLLQASQPEL